MGHKIKSISKLKKDLDKWFSLYIRLRNATETGLAQCFTCGKIAHYKTLQCGHFQSRRHLATRYCDINCQVQCIKCNMYEQGEQFKFGMNLDYVYGFEKAEEMQYNATTLIKISRAEYEEKIAYYKSLVNKIKKQKGIE